MEFLKKSFGELPTKSNVTSTFLNLRTKIVKTAMYCTACYVTNNLSVYSAVRLSQRSTKLRFS